MNSIELHLPNGKPAGIFFCEKCRVVYPSHTAAENCCQNYKCSKCGADTGGRSWLVCDPCRKAEDARKERERFEKAEKLTEWKGWLYSDHYGYNNGYFEEIEELIDYCEDEEVPVPEYVWTCDENHFVCADVSDITERMVDEAYEDFDADDLHGLDELKKALDVFNEANKDQVSFTPNYKKAVLISNPQ